MSKLIPAEQFRAEVRARAAANADAAGCDEKQKAIVIAVCEAWLFSKPAGLAPGARPERQ